MPSTDPIRLSICIPTYNRDVYLESLLTRIDAEIAPYRDVVEVVISDNASTDRTAEVCALYGGRPNFVYRRRDTHAVAERNFLDVVAAANGEYCWLFGDDEILLPGAIGTILRLIEEHTPELLHVSCENTQFVSSPVTFDGLRPFVEYFAGTRPRTVIDISLITTAVFRRSLWMSVPDKERLMHTRYLHALVFAEALRDGGRIAIVPARVFEVRRQRAPFAERNLQHEIPARQLQYLHALAEMTGSRALLGYCRREKLAILWRAPLSFSYETFSYSRAVVRIAVTAFRSLTASRRGTRRRDQ